MCKGLWLKLYVQGFSERNLSIKSNFRSEFIVSVKIYLRDKTRKNSMRIQINEYNKSHVCTAFIQIIENSKKGSWAE